MQNIKFKILLSVSDFKDNIYIYIINKLRLLIQVVRNKCVALQNFQRKNYPGKNSKVIA